ncbi:hypothetical protein AAFC00_003721 [Neodothiora populina]|uniref:Peroxisomal ATPase PEX1 n=1 Tax=Neodothiora populina TaxID=2781224 RepID=A0ABR3PFM5_9PEZI
MSLRTRKPERGGAAAPALNQADVVLLPQLKSCLANLPSSLVNVLVNANTVAQNVVVELTFQPPAVTSGSDEKAPLQSRSIYLGWTGMQSQHRLAPMVDKRGINRSGGRQDQDVATVEIDAALARMLAITDGQKVGVMLHIDPPQAHTVNIEPLTPTDWDIIELHARFLEMNFLSQIRALPNPAFAPNHAQQHPLTLHLTPTSTANIIVTSLTPALASTEPFAKISSDAEVIVAPKSRQQPSRSSNRESRSVASTSRKSMRSTTSTVRHRSLRDENLRHPVFLRAVDRKVVDEWFDDNEPNSSDLGLRVWVDRDLLLTKSLKGVSWVAVSIVKPASLQEPIDSQTAAAETNKPTQKVVARLCAWEDGPDSHHAALSSMLGATVASVGIVGGIVRIEAAPAQLPRTTSAMKGTEKKEVVVKTLKVAPFIETGSRKSTSLKFGGESEKERAAAALKLRSIFGASEDGTGLLDGPITDGMILPAEAGQANDHAWPGGILHFDPKSSSGSGNEASKSSVQWLQGSERKLNIEIQPEIAKPSDLTRSGPGHELPLDPPKLVGVDKIITDLETSLQHSSSILLTGGLGSGKTAVAHLLAHRLRKDELFHVTYFPCAPLITDETRVSTIKETLQRLFGGGAWGARQGGHSLVVLDDIDKLCPVETELQVGGENGRSRQVSELLCSIAKQHCSRESGVVLLATAQAKESVNNVVIGGHVVRDIVALKAPNKDGRRRVLEMLVHQKETVPRADVSQQNGNAWMDGHSDVGSVTKAEPGFIVDPAMDLLETAGQTDGYMPGDLSLLVSRAQSEALIRSVASDTSSSDISAISLTQDDFAAALKGFTPASLRNVTLQASSTTFASIGGLKETRQTLLETLQYPTTYAPIFAQCPLRLRSGLLLYGYPGCGKTLLASAVAGECGLNFISVKGPEILNKYIGASEKSVRDLFDRAEAARPCVLFFDEFDSIAPKRGHDSTGVTDRVVNQLLTQMDGAEGLSGVYVLAATSRPDLIDPALLRPGRLDKSLLCDMPALDDRLDILRAVTGQLKISPGIMDGEGSESLWEVAKQTEGYSGADLQAVMYNAHLEAIHDVLGPADMVQELGKSKDGVSKKSKPKDFAYFRFDDTQSTNGTSTDAMNGTLQARQTPAQLAERAAIAAKLAQMDIARRRARQQRLQDYASASSDSFNATGMNEQKEDDDDDRQQEPIIEWSHIVKSMETTRPSISRKEIGRLRAIYSEFIDGRNGDMPDGQANTEIGGRTSLM